VQDFESAMRAVCEPIFERPISEISFGQLLVYLFRTARRFDMQVQPSLVLLQKTLLNIEGLGRQLYPELNLWETAQPFLETWVQERYSPQSVLKRLQRHAPSWLEQLPQLPDVVMDNLQHSRDMEQRFNDQQQQTRNLQARVQTDTRRRRRHMIAALACLAAALMMFPGAVRQLTEAPLAAWLLAGLGLALLWPRES
jgi:ubiquinone biosynthesis protein